MTARPKRFSVAGGTLPTADEAVDTATSRRQDVAVPAARAAERTAFTWRLTSDQALALDEMMLRLRRQLGRGKLDKSEMLAELVGLAEDNPAVFAALAARMEAD